MSRNKILKDVDIAKKAKLYSTRTKEAEKNFNILQEIYLRKKDSKTFELMMIELYVIIRAHLYIYMKRHKIYISKERREDLAHNVLVRVLERYKRNPNWKTNTNTMAAFYFDCFKVITQQQNKEDKQQRFEDNCFSLNEKE